MSDNRKTRKGRNPAATDRDAYQQIEALTGIQYPPNSASDWSRLFRLAGLPHERLEQLLCQNGVSGFEECGELPSGYGSTKWRNSANNQPLEGGELSCDDGFLLTEAILAGLEPLRREQLEIPEADRGPTLPLKAYASAVNRDSRTLKIAIDDGSVRGDKISERKWRLSVSDLAARFQIPISSLRGKLNDSVAKKHAKRQLSDKTEPM